MTSRFELAVDGLDRRAEERQGLRGTGDATYLKIRGKMIYELGQLKRLKEFLEWQSRNWFHSMSPKWQDLVNRQVHFNPETYDPADPAKTDRTNPVVTISPSHAWGIPLSERIAMGKAFRLDTLCGAEQAVQWLEKQIKQLYRTPIHSQPASPWRKKSQYLIDAQELLVEWRIQRDQLREETKTAQVVHINADVFQVLYAMPTGDYTSFESSVEVTDKRTKLKTVYLASPKKRPASSCTSDKTFPHPDILGVVYAAAPGTAVNIATDDRPPFKYTLETAEKRYDFFTDTEAHFRLRVERMRRAKQAARDRAKAEKKRLKSLRRKAAKKVPGVSKKKVIASDRPRFKLPPAAIEKLKQGMVSAAPPPPSATSSYAPFKPAAPAHKPRAGDAAAGTRPPTPASSPVAAPLTLTSSLAHTADCFPTASPAYATDSQPSVDPAAETKTASAGNPAAGTSPPRPATSSTTAPLSALDSASPTSATISHPSASRSTAPSAPRARDPAAATTRPGPPPNAPKGPKGWKMKRQR